MKPWRETAMPLTIVLSKWESKDKDINPHTGCMQKLCLYVPNHTIGLSSPTRLLITFVYLLVLSEKGLSREYTST